MTRAVGTGPAPGIEHPAPPGTPTRAGDGTAWRWTAAVATAAAAALHATAAADHLTAGDLVVGFFLVAALAQLGAAAWLAAGAATGLRSRLDPLFLAAVLAGTVALLLLYLAAHTTEWLDPLVGAGHDAHGATGAGGATAGAGGTGHEAHTTVVGPVALDAEPAAVREAPVLGTATAAAELLTVVAVGALLPARARRLVLDGLLVLGGLVWALWLTGVLG